MRVAVVILPIVIFFFIQTAECQEIAMRRIHIRGKPKILKAGTKEWVKLKVDSPICDGDRIKTQHDEVVELGFEYDPNDNLIRIEEDSDVLIRVGENPDEVEIVNEAATVVRKNIPMGSTKEAFDQTSINSM